MEVELEIPPLPPPPQSQQQSSYFSCNDGTNMNNLNLNQQAMLNQFISIAGCSMDQAFHLLSSSNWQYQAALNSFFDEAVSNMNMANTISVNAPSNTPVTPPNIDFLEKAFSKLNSSLISQTDQSIDMNRNLSLASLKQSQPFTETQYLESARFNYYNN